MYYYAYLWGDHADSPKLVLVSNNLDELKNKLSLDAKCMTFDEMIDYDEMQDVIDRYNEDIDNDPEYQKYTLEDFNGPATDYNSNGNDYILSSNAKKKLGAYYLNGFLYNPERLSIFALENINVNFNKVLECIHNHIAW